MTLIFLTMILSICIFGSIPILGNINQKENSKRTTCFLWILFGSAALLRLFCAAISHGFDNDTACFAAWSERVYQVGFKQFYSPDVFTDYPPGYILLLWPIGAIRNLLNITYYSGLHLILLRLPAILCDLGCGALLYKESRKKFAGFIPLLLAAVYLFNPAVILNSSVWGQVDSVYTILLVLMCLCMIRGNMPLAYLCFFPGLLIKPQVLIFAPILFAGFLDQVIFHKFTVKKLLINIGAGVFSLLLTFILVLPFGAEAVVKQYMGTVTSYPYAAVNACNFWGMLGKNWASQTETFLGISYKAYGMAAIVLTVIGVLLYSIRHRKNRTKYPLLCGILMACIFVFSVRMHERYLYPAVILLLFAILYCPSKKLYFSYCGLSLLHFLNAADVLFFYDPTAYDARKPLIILVSAGTVAMLFFLLYSVHVCANGKALPDKELLFSAGGTGKCFAAMKERFLSPVKPAPSAPKVKYSKADLLIVAALTLAYAWLAFTDLGDKAAPQTEYALNAGESLTFTFDMNKGELPARLTSFVALPNDITFEVSGKYEIDSDWTYLGTMDVGSVFTWMTTDIPGMGTFLYSPDIPGDYFTLRLTLLTQKATLLEFHFTDIENFNAYPMNTDAYAALFDEHSLVPLRSTFRNGMYFDEIYHARTAYEFIKGENTYEFTHPPLGKILISLGIRLFGMVPFGWRFVGTLFGVLMVPLAYLFGKELIGETYAGILTCILYTFDFMHFTQSRLSTIDVYISFFVILMYFFMWRYSRQSFYDTPTEKTWIPLGLCGISMGLGVASKWTGVYAGLGLAVIFFALLFLRYREYAYVKANAKDSKENRRLMKRFQPAAMQTLIFCVIFFAVIPFFIYLLSYIPFRDGTDSGLFARMWHNQQAMLNYHSGLDATHPYSSHWYEWPVMVRPMWYYSGIVTGVWGEGGLREGISAFGNPLVWWIGIPAFFYMIYLAAKQKDRTAAFLIVGYLAQYLPWFAVTRVTFIYHYFPSVIFVVLMITYSLAQLKPKMKPGSFYLLLTVYCLLVILLFTLFLPVLSGQPVEAAFVDKYLRWFKSWVLAAS